MRPNYLEKLTFGTIETKTKDSFRRTIIIKYNPRLKDITAKEAEKLVHIIIAALSSKSPKHDTYCMDIEAYVIPFELEFYEPMSSSEQLPPRTSDSSKLIEGDCEKPRANRDLTKCNFENIDFSTFQPGPINLFGANLSKVNMKGANLQQAHLVNTNLSGANLYGAYLYKSTLKKAIFIRANLSGANLSSVDFSEANLSQAIVTDANFSHVDFFYTKNLQTVEKLDTAIVKKATFDGLYLPIEGLIEQLRKKELKLCIN